MKISLHNKSTKKPAYINRATRFKIVEISFRWPPVKQTAHSSTSTKNNVIIKDRIDKDSIIVSNMKRQLVRKKTANDRYIR